MDLRNLTVEDVIAIHDVLVRDFARDRDPISPPGIRSAALLESAVSRQHVGFLGSFKYPDPIDNAATLAFGICQNHPFFNGNKRTALVSLLVHLDHNKLSLTNVTQDELYELMLSIAQHTIGLEGVSVRFRRLLQRRHQDSEVAAIAQWVRQRVVRITRGERIITYVDLRRILERHGFALGDKKNNSIDVLRLETEHYGFLNLRTRTVAKRIGNIPYPGERREISVDLIKKIRSMCHLCEEHGVDSDVFYNNGSPVDAFVNRYRTVLRRLART